MSEIMTAAAVLQQLLALIKAKFSLINIRSVEERRVQAGIFSIAEQLNMGVYLWSIAGGMLKVGDDKAMQIDDPMQALQFISEQRTRAIFVLRDFDPYIEPSPANAANIRKLRELADELANAKKSEARVIILLGPKLVLPESLRATMVVIDWPLPDKEELKETAKSVVRSLPSDLKSGLPKDDAQTTRLLSDVATASQGLTLIEAQNAFALSAIKNKTIKPGEVSAYKEQAVTKSGLLEWRKPRGGFSRVAGLVVLRQWLVERRLGFSEAARAYGLDLPKGILLAGCPGCGKSAMADAVAFEWDIPLLGWDVGKTFGKYQGQSEEQIRAVISTAEAVAPCILRVDEIEKGFSGMGGSGEADGGSSARMFSTFLTWMQEKQSAVFVYATCNDADKLPAELLRKGRFDEKFFVDLPNEEERKGIWEVHLRIRGREPEKFDLDALVEASIDMSGAEIEGTLVDAMFSAFAKDEEVTTGHILAATSNTVPLNKAAPERIEKVRAWAKGRARLASAPMSNKNGKSASRFDALES